MGIRDYLDSLGIENDILVTDNESLINRARNNLCATFLKTDYETIAFIDADIEIGADDFYRLLQMKGVRGAPVPLKSKHGHLNVTKDQKPLKSPLSDSKPFRATFLGTAVLLVDRTVLTSLAVSRACKRYIDPIVGEAYEFFPTYVSDETLWSEDYGFCRLLQAAKIPIWCVPMAVGHYGVIEI